MGLEVWKPVVGFPDYEVSSLGRVLSRRKSATKLRYLTPRASSWGYLSVHVTKEKFNGRMKQIHHLVLEAFVGPRLKGFECAHLDGNPANNRLKNLAWVTRVENEAHKKLHGTHQLGSRCWNAKLNEHQVRHILKTYRRGQGRLALAKQYGISIKTLEKILGGSRWKHVYAEVRGEK